jgi:hypothetical protein
MDAKQWLVNANEMGIGATALTKDSHGNIAYHFGKPRIHVWSDGSWEWRNDYSKNGGKGLGKHRYIVFPNGVYGFFIDFEKGNIHHYAISGGVSEYVWIGVDNLKDGLANENF